MSGAFITFVVILMIALVPFIIRNWIRQWNGIKTKASEDQVRRDRDR